MRGALNLILVAVIPLRPGITTPSHAVEAYVSVYANDSPDGLAPHAIRLVFSHLEAAVTDGEGAPEARMFTGRVEVGG
jgi:acetaldehyde dehydrogenase/alcohol dehydrogenase